MMFFLKHGFRVIAHDRRGHGRSTQTDQGHDMSTYAADAAEVVKALDLSNAIHIGHSTGGGEVARYVAQYGKGRVAKAVLISAIPSDLYEVGKKSRWSTQGGCGSAFEMAPATTARSFFRTLLCHSTVLIDQAQKYRRESAITGGGRE